MVAASIALLLATAPGRAHANQIVAYYSAYWAGLPAAQIRLRLGSAAAAYSDEIEICTDGLPRLFTHFRGRAEAEGRLVPGETASPTRYDARYDLRKRKNSHIGMRFVSRNGTAVAERSPDDTSRKPPLAEKFRRGIVDPLTAFERIRGAIAAGRSARDASFTVPVYDGARRFDVLGRILPKEDQDRGVLRVELTLRPIAGFKGETSEDGDPDDAPRPAALTLTDDARLLPTAMTVRVYFLPLVLRFEQLCQGATPCSSGCSPQQGGS